MSAIHEKFKIQFNERKIAINTTTFVIIHTLYKIAYDEFKHIVKRKLFEDKQKFVVRACLESEEALDSCWKWQLIGLRPTEETTPFLSTQYKDWRDLIK